MARPLRGGGVRARPQKKTELFFYIFIYFSRKLWRIFFFQNPFPAILRRKKGLSGRATKKRTFFAASLSSLDKYC